MLNIYCKKKKYMCNTYMQIYEYFLFFVETKFKKEKKKYISYYF